MGSLISWKMEELLAPQVEPFKSPMYVNSVLQCGFQGLQSVHGLQGSQCGQGMLQGDCAL